MNVDSRPIRCLSAMLVAAMALCTLPVLLVVSEIEEPLYQCFTSLDCGAVIISSFFSIVLLLDRFFDDRNRAFIRVLLCISGSFYIHAVSMVSWKVYCGETPTFLLLNLEYILMSFALLVMLHSLGVFLSPIQERYRRSMSYGMALFAIQTILVLQNLVTHNLWYVDGGALVHNKLYWLIFLMPLLQNILYLVACVRIASIKLRGIGFAFLMVLSLIAVACMLPKYYSTIHFLAVLFPMLLILPYIYNISGVELEHGKEGLRIRRETLKISDITSGEIDHTLAVLESRDDIPADVSDALEKLRKYINDNTEYFLSTSFIPLEKELGNVEAFLYLEKLRYTSRLNIEYDLKEANVSVPPLCMQILVENAIKHGVSKRPEGGTVRLSTGICGGNLVISVSDDGVGFDVNAPRPNIGRRHVGTDNLRSRLESVGGSLIIESTPGKGTVATINIPLSE